MKKIILAAIILFSSVFAGYAQQMQKRVEITPFVGYMFGETIQTSYGDIRLDDNVQYGGMLSLVTRFFDVDFLYSREDTKAEMRGLYNYPIDYGYLNDVNLSISYFQVGATKHIRANERIAPFAGVNIGACLMSPKETFDDVWRFSVGAHLGTKIYLTERIGIRLQGQMLIPVQSEGLFFSVGTNGAGAGIDFESTIFQFAVNAGVIIRL